MDRLNRVLVGIDFSECAGIALHHAVRIAAWSKAKVKALYAAPIPAYLIDPQPFFPAALPPINLLVDDARDRWAQWPPAREAGPGVEFEAVLGNPRREILDHAAREKPDLVVLGAHSDLDAKRRLGHVAAAVVQRCPSRVLLVREAQRAPFRSVVAAVDFSETSGAALDQAIRIAAQDDASLHVLHVYNDPWWGIGPPDEVRKNMPDLAEKYRDAIEKRLRDFCQPCARQLGALKATFHAEMHEGHGLGVVEFIRRERIDLAVVGTRAKWNLRDFLLGSTAERIVRDAPCSILAIKPGDFPAD